MRGGTPFNNGAEDCDCVKQASDYETNGYNGKNDPQRSRANPRKREKAEKKSKHV
jgi:hypothetical protein